MTPAMPPLASRDRVSDAVLVVSCGILQAAALAVAAFATRDAFAALHSGAPLARGTILELAGAGGIAALCFFLSRYRGEALGQSYAISLRAALYQKIAQLPKSRHEERRVGALSLRFVGDLSAARLWFGRGLPDVLSATIVLPSAIAILIALSPALAMAGLAALCLALLVMAGSAWHLGRRHKRLRQRRANIAISMIERIAIAPELDQMGRTRREMRRLEEQGASLRRDALARRARTTNLQATLQLGVAASGLLILWQASLHGIAPATVAASLSVLALVALPLQDLGAAWDHYCAWRVARSKAERLLSEPSVVRKRRRASIAATVEVSGILGHDDIAFVAPAGKVTVLSGRHAGRLGRHISGLDAIESVQVRYGGQEKQPRIAYIGDRHIGLQGSLRRSATLMCRKRPSDRKVTRILKVFGLEALLSAPKGLDQRVSENGHGLSPEQTLRLDLVRAILDQAEIIVIHSVRWSSSRGRTELLEMLQQNSSATVIITQAEDLHPQDVSTKAK